MATSPKFLEKGERSIRPTPIRRTYRLPLLVLFWQAVIVVSLWFVLPVELWKLPSALLKPGKKSAVPLEIHIMSKCPDARDCLKELILPTMEKVSSKVNFTMSFIGRSTDDDGVECMHGETECLGNIVELCAAELYPDPKVYLGFTMCLSNDYKKIPQEDFVEGCAFEHGMQITKLNACMSRDDGGYALDKLRASFNRTKDAGVTKSCTVRLNDKIRCIRDGGKWSDCDDGSEPKDLISDVEALYDNASAIM